MQYNALTDEKEINGAERLCCLVCVSGEKTNGK